MIILILIFQLTNFEPESYIFSALNIEIESVKYKKVSLNLNELDYGEKLDAELCYFFDSKNNLKKIDIEFYRTMYKSKCIYYVLENNIIVVTNIIYNYDKPYYLEDYKVIDTLNFNEIWEFNNKIKPLKKTDNLKYSEDVKTIFYDFINYKNYIKFE